MPRKTNRQRVDALKIERNDIKNEIDMICCLKCKIYKNTDQYEISSDKERFKSICVKCLYDDKLDLEDRIYKPDKKHRKRLHYIKACNKSKKTDSIYKVCKNCKINKSLCHYYRKLDAVDGKTAICIQCIKIQRKKKYDEEKKDRLEEKECGILSDSGCESGETINAIIMKICKICNISKNISDFDTCIFNKNIISDKCLVCQFNRYYEFIELKKSLGFI